MPLILNTIPLALAKNGLFLFWAKAHRVYKLLPQPKGYGYLKNSDVNNCE